MNINTLKQLFQEDEQFENTSFFENPSFAEAIVGHTDDGRLVYCYEDMVPAAMNEKPDWTEDDAIDWVESNTIPTIPYMGEKAPIIIHRFEE